MNLLPVVLIALVFIAQSGCITDNLSADRSNNTIDNNSSVATVSTDITTDNSSRENTTFNQTPFTVSLKKTGVVEFENNYSLKLISVDRQNEQIQVSLRRNGNEYNLETLKSGRTYSISDTENKDTIYTVTVDRILDNNFVVNFTFQMKPGIMLETGFYEGKAIKSEVHISQDSITRTYRWQYENTDFIVEYEYNIEAYDMYSERTRNRDYTNFVNDPYDDELISQITKQMGQLAEENGYDKEEVPYIAMAFVQSLPYVSDSVSSGYDEYPRFPFETLYHGGGDCEDSSILLAALLNDMDYGVALIELPGHMAVGVKGSSELKGNYYTYDGSRYYYLETTNSGWDVGVVPDQYINEEATVIPVSSGYPQLDVTFTGTGRVTKDLTYVDIDIEVQNVGSSVADDVVIYATVETATEGMVWDDMKTETGIDLDVEESLKYSVSDLKVPSGEKYRLGIWAWSANADTEYVYSDWIKS